MAYSNHLRSSSYPPKSNPILQKIDDELIKLRKSEASSTSLIQSICIGLKGLARLYRCVDDVLSLPLLAQQKISQNDKQIIPLIEGSSKLLEVCESSKHILAKLLDALRALESSNIDAVDISSYFACRKEVAKQSKGIVLELREIEERLVSKCEFNDDEFEVIRVLRCVSIINISVLESLLRYISMPLMSSKGKSHRFGLFSKLAMKKQTKSVISSEEKLPKGENELSNVDVFLHAFEGEKLLQDVGKKRLQVLEGSLKGIEDGLNNMFKQLTKTRASLMKIISV